MCNSVAYIITTKYFWVPGKKKRKKTNKCVWLLSIYCGFLFYLASLICSSVECLYFYYCTPSPCPTHKRCLTFSIWTGPPLCLSCLVRFVLPELSGWPAAGGCVLLAACHAAGFRVSERSSGSPATFRCHPVWASCASGAKTPQSGGGQRDDACRGSAAAREGDSVPAVSTKPPASAPALLPVLTTVEERESLTLKASLFPSEHFLTYC